MKNDKLNFGIELKAILTSLQTASHWAAQLGVSRSATTQWFNGESKPKPENLYLIREVLSNSNKTELIEKFNNLCEYDSSLFQDGLIKFNADNLNDYIANFQYKRLIKRIENIVVPIKNRETYYSNFSVIIKFISYLSGPVFNLFFEIISNLLNEINLYDPKIFDKKVQDKLEIIKNELNNEIEVYHNDNLDLMELNYNWLLTEEDLKSSSETQLLLSERRNILTTINC